LRKKRTAPTSPTAADSFDGLVNAIEGIDKHFVAQAGKAINIALTLRNWLIGAYIREYRTKWQRPRQLRRPVAGTVS